MAGIRIKRQHQGRLASGFTKIKFPVVSALYSKKVLNYVGVDAKSTFVYSTYQYFWAVNKFLCTQDTKAALGEIEAEKRFAVEQCNLSPDAAASKFYFCKLKSFANILEKCEHPLSCALDPIFQDFLRFKFIVYSNPRGCMINVAKAMVTKLYHDVYSPQFPSNVKHLRQLVDEYGKYIAVPESECRSLNPHIQCYDSYCIFYGTMRSDCVMKALLIPIEKMLKSKDYSQERKDELLVWLSYMPYATLHGQAFNKDDIKRIKLNMLKRASALVSTYDTDGLIKFASKFPSYTLLPFSVYHEVCEKAAGKIIPQYDVYCELSPLISDVSLYINAYENSQHATVRKLDPDTDYVTLLDQLQNERGQTKVTLNVENFIDQLGKYLTDLQKKSFLSLSSYFSCIAEFNIKKSKSDIGYIQQKMSDFKSKITTLTGDVEKLFSTTLSIAIGASVVELA